jgi:hypothetical protein
MNPLTLSEIIKKPKEIGPRPSLLIKSVTNVKKLRDMFDFTTKKNKLSKFHVLEPVILGLDKNKPFCIPKNKPWEELKKQKGNINLLSISKAEESEEHCFSVDYPGSFVKYEHPKQETWVVVGTLRDGEKKEQLGFELSVGDVIKMGREKYRVTELRQWVNEEKDKLMEHSTYYKSVLGGLLCYGDNL